MSLWVHCPSSLLPNNFHIFICSSPAPVAMYCPDGLKAQYRTLLEWAWIVIYLFLSLFHIMIWLREKPWQLTIYSVFLEATRAHIWLPVSISEIMPSPSFQNLIFRSRVPPPLIKVLGMTQSKALMAARCW